MPEVLVIGAGPAGSAAAIALAAGGAAVTVVEQHRFPRDKVCGECLSALGHDVLERLGADEAFRRAGPVRLVRAIVHAAGGRSAEAPLPRPMWGLSRERLDALLLDEAVRHGAAVLQPARAESVLGGAPPRVRLRDLTNNEVTERRPDVVVVAEGKGVVGRTAPPPPTADFGIKAQFVDVEGPPDAIELFATAGRYGGLAPIGGGRWNAAFSVAGWQLKQVRGDVEALFQSLVAGSRALAHRLRRARRVGPWLASPLPRHAVRDRWPLNVVPVGNAAAAIEPIGGEGMGLALRSGELAAAAILDGGEFGTLAARYRELWRVRRPACRAAAVTLAAPWASGSVMRLVGAAPPLLRLGMRLVGK